MHGFIRDSAGTITTFDATGAGTQGLGTTAYAVNASQTVAGTLSDAQGFEHGFIRTADGTFTTFEAPGASETWAYTINDSGVVAGVFYDGSAFRGFVRDTSGAFTTFNPPTTPASFGISRINDSGTVVGYYVDGQLDSLLGISVSPDGTVGVVAAPGQMPGSGAGTRANDINSTGTIVGALFLNAQPASHSFMVDAAGNYTVFDPPAAGPQGSEAWSINDSGEIVGDYLDSEVIRHGYVREADGTFVTFDDPDAALLRFSPLNQGTAPRRINASSVVAGFYSDSAGTRHGFIGTNLASAP